MDVVTRDEWNAAPPKFKPVRFSRATEGVFLHYTAAESDRQAGHQHCADRVRSIQAFHQGPSRDWNDIAYSFLYCVHGYAFEGRGWGVQGAHTMGYNSTSHAFCFLGNDVKGRDDLTDKGREAVTKLIREAQKLYPQSKQVRGHRQVNETACPGDEIMAYIACRGWKVVSLPPTKKNGFWKWLAWYEQSREKETRPKGVPDKIPDEWWARREKLVGKKKGKK